MMTSTDDAVAVAVIDDGDGGPDATTTMTTTNATLHDVHLRVTGMMCQKNCGTTVQNALLSDVPGAVSSRAVHATCYATVSVDLAEFARKSSGGDDSAALPPVGSPERKSLEESVSEEAVDAVECVGFEAESIPAGEVEDYLRKKEEEAKKAAEEAAAQRKLRADMPSMLSEGSSDASTGSAYDEMSGLMLSAHDDEFDNEGGGGASSEKERNGGTASLEVAGMSCAVCTGRVEKALLSVDGVAKAAVSLPTGRARVVFHARRSSLLDDEEDEESAARARHLADECAEAVTKGGYECSVLHVSDPSSKNKGGSGDEGGISLADNAARMEKARRAELDSWRRHLLAACAFTVPLVAIHYGTMKCPYDMDGPPNWVDWAGLYLSTPVQFGVGRRFYSAAWKSFRMDRVLGMDFLVCMGTTAAYVYSVIVFCMKMFAYGHDESADAAATAADEADATTSMGDMGDGHSHHLKPTFETGAMLLTFVTLGKFLEAYAKGKTAGALQTLMQLQPTMATRVTVPPEYILRKESEGKKSAAGEEEGPELDPSVNLNQLSKEEVDINDVKVGDYLLVIPGARIPTDGVLVARDGLHKGSDSGPSKTTTSAYVDESAFSGEPFPVPKSPGDSLYGSSVNQLSVLLVRVTATGSGTVLARIVRLIEEAQSSRAPVQAHADAVASVFAPTVLVLSLVTFCAWIVCGGNMNVTNQERLFTALMSAISVVVVACPCALGLAAPTAVMVGTGVGATNGLLIKGGAALEAASGVDTVVFDKTGTITTGRAVLTDRVEFLADGRKGAAAATSPRSAATSPAGNGEGDVDDAALLAVLPPSVKRDDAALWLAACAETNSEHPLANAVVNSARGIWGADVTRSREGVKVTDFRVVPGRGVECLVRREGAEGGWWVRVGNRGWVNELPGAEEGGKAQKNDDGSVVPGVGDEEVLAIRRKGEIGVYVSVSPDAPSSSVAGGRRRRRVVGVLGIADSVESEAKSTVSALRRMGVDVWMCTGDNEVTAYAVADEVGIPRENVCAGVSPEGKADLVTRLQRRRDDGAERRSRRDKRGKNSQKSKVAVVGDGINDSVALARADVGIAIGAGTEVAVEAASVVLVRSSLHDVVVALHLSRVVFRRIRLNFVWAMAYNVFAIPFAAGALYPFTDWRLPPAFAGLMMAFSSVSVVTSSLLLRTYDRPVVHEDGRVAADGTCGGGCRLWTGCVDRMCDCLTGRSGRRRNYVVTADEECAVEMGGTFV